MCPHLAFPLAIGIARISPFASPKVFACSPRRRPNWPARLASSRPSSYFLTTSFSSPHAVPLSPLDAPFLLLASTHPCSSLLLSPFVSLLDVPSFRLPNSVSRISRRCFLSPPDAPSLQSTTPFSSASYRPFLSPPDAPSFRLRRPFLWPPTPFPLASDAPSLQPTTLLPLAFKIAPLEYHDDLQDWLNKPRLIVSRRGSAASPKQRFLTKKGGVKGSLARSQSLLRKFLAKGVSYRNWLLSTRASWLPPLVLPRLLKRLAVCVFIFIVIWVVLNGFFPSSADLAQKGEGEREVGRPSPAAPLTEDCLVHAGRDRAVSCTQWHSNPGCAFGFICILTCAEAHTHAHIRMYFSMCFILCIQLHICLQIHTHHYAHIHVCILTHNIDR